MKRKSALTATIKRSPRAVQALRPREGASPTQPGQLPGQLLPRRLPLAINLSDAVTREEEPCRQSSALAVSILEHLPNMVFLKEAKELRFVHFNKAGEELLGYSRYDLLGKNDYDLFLNEQAEFFTAKEREVLSGGRLVDIPEELIQTRHKGVRILHTKKIPICDAEGVPQYLLGISEDITERKEVEKILLNTKAELKRRVVQRTAKLLEVNAGLQREIAERQVAEESLRDLGARLIYAQEEERGRIAREIHDDLCQQLALIGVELDQMRQRMRSVAGDEEAALENLLQKVRQVSVDLSGLSHDLHPSKLDHLGLPTAVRSLCREVSRLHKVKIHCAMADDVPESLPRPVALCLYRIVQEALHNMVKHSGARNAQVSISGRNGMMTLVVSDSGRGFDPSSREAEAGIGLISMRKRTRMIGGRIAIQSAPSRGTKIEIQAPQAKSVLPQC